MFLILIYLIINPKYDAINVPLTTPLTITFSEIIVKGISYNDIYVKNINTRKLVQITKTTSKNILTIKMTESRLQNDKYIIYIPKDAFKDQTRNYLTSAHTIPFKTGKNEIIIFYTFLFILIYYDTNNFIIT